MVSDPPTGGMLQESQTLSSSAGTAGTRRTARLSVASSVEGGVAGGAAEEVRIGPVVT